MTGIATPLQWLERHKNNSSECIGTKNPSTAADAGAAATPAAAAEDGDMAAIANAVVAVTTTQ